MTKQEKFEFLEELNSQTKLLADKYDIKVSEVMDSVINYLAIMIYAAKEMGAIATETSNEVVTEAVKGSLDQYLNDLEQASTIDKYLH